jgi:hypothetical protein
MKYIVIIPDKSLGDFQNSILVVCKKVVENDQIECFNISMIIMNEGKVDIDSPKLSPGDDTFSFLTFEHKSIKYFPSFPKAFQFWYKENKNSISKQQILDAIFKHI